MTNEERDKKIEL